MSFISRLKIVDSIFSPLKSFCDNSTDVFMVKTNKIGSRSKHINIKYLAIREKVKDKLVAIQHISTDLIIVDTLTKCMPPIKFRIIWRKCDLVLLYDCIYT